MLRSYRNLIIGKYRTKHGHKAQHRAYGHFVCACSCKWNEKECGRHFVCRKRSLGFLWNDLRTIGLSMEEFDWKSNLLTQSKRFRISTMRSCIYLDRNKSSKCAQKAKTSREDFLCCCRFPTSSYYFEEISIRGE